MVFARPDRRRVFAEMLHERLRAGDAPVEPDAVHAVVLRLSAHVDRHLGHGNEVARLPSERDDAVRVVVFGLRRVVTPLEALDRVLAQREVHAGRRVRDHGRERLHATQPVRLFLGVVGPVDAEPETPRGIGEVETEEHGVRPGDRLHRLAVVGSLGSHRDHLPLADAPPGHGSCSLSRMEGLRSTRGSRVGSLASPGRFTDRSLPASGTFRGWGLTDRVREMYTHRTHTGGPGSYERAGGVGTPPPSSTRAGSYEGRRSWLERAASTGEGPSQPMVRGPHPSVSTAFGPDFASSVSSNCPGGTV